MTNIKDISDKIKQKEAYRKIESDYGQKNTFELEGLSGSSYSLVAAEIVKQFGGIHVFVAEDKDEAAYISNDLYNVLDQEKVNFFPTGYKRSVQYGQEDPSGIIQRTSTLSAIKNFSDGYLVICTWPEAIMELVTERETLKKNTVILHKGDRIEGADLENRLIEYGFERVDFVYEPGQYSVRGGIIDVFSFSESKPYRLDFFGNDLESIRAFDLTTQLSVSTLDHVEIVPNLKSGPMSGGKVTFPEFVGEATYWIEDIDHTVKKIQDTRKKLLKEIEAPEKINSLITGGQAFLKDIGEKRVFLRKSSLKDRMPDVIADFRTVPQPAFNKQFVLLADNISDYSGNGYKVFILSENKAQIERITNIFNSIGRKEPKFQPLSVTLHRGFIDNELKICLYTDHQIFERYHRYRLDKQIDRNEALTIAELNSLKVGDYVVHIDHGVGKFGGLVKTSENGKVHEAIKLVYRDNDVLLVNVHALHRISKYKDKESEPPKIYKLGTGAWQKMKAATKKAVKDIARELISLYARRMESEGFAFSPDGYMQHELEASFIYEDTPDQVKTTEAVKTDMESHNPMDRLVCGDVGFGKTEIAIRAAFKAVNDGKQVAILVPTTVLSLQHYRTFSDRLKEFPVRIEHLSRVKSTKEVREILADLENGKIDILIGTHKILGKEIKFKDLGLLIIDEEQKFGVSSKEKLRQMKVGVDTLTLTATPIPRTLQFSLMGSRDLSVISTPPLNRQPITTESHTFDREIIKEAVDFELARHGQVYFVHNRIEDINKIKGLLEELSPGVKVVVAHGRMNPKELEKILLDFIYAEYDVLLSTTIIENGIDIPNANTIIINNAQNFGLSDLHQLRGRVGRSTRKAFCYLLTPPDEMLSTEARRRLRALEEFSDLGSGFNIAMQDLDIRGAGNLLGAEQSGFIADIGFETYQKILNEAMEELHAEGIGNGPQTATNTTGEDIFLADAHIDTDTEAFIPDSYVSQSAEKIKLYRELDNIKDEQALASFGQKLTDRFGEVPTQIEELFNVVRLRWIMTRMGFERAKLNNGTVIFTFISDPDSRYYKSSFFGCFIKEISHRPEFIFRQNNHKLTLKLSNIKGTGQVLKILAGLYERIKDCEKTQELE